jgi:hypothetical protein
MFIIGVTKASYDYILIKCNMKSDKDCLRFSVVSLNGLFFTQILYYNADNLSLTSESEARLNDI